MKTTRIIAERIKDYRKGRNTLCCLTNLVYGSDEDSYQNIVCDENTCQYYAPNCFTVSMWQRCVK